MLRWIRSWNRFDWGWIAIGVAALALEVAAIRDTKPGGTLSSAFWWGAGIGEERHRYVRIVRVMAVCGAAWAVAHLFTRKV